MDSRNRESAGALKPTSVLQPTTSVEVALKVAKVSKAQAVKYKDQQNANRERADLAKAAKSFAAGQ